MKSLLAGLVFVAAIAAALVLTAGGGKPDAEREAAAPALMLTRMDGQGQVALSELASAHTPTLLWFWAPWCSICNGEAPRIQALAKRARGRLAVVAIGGRDDLANGPAFVERHGLTAPTVLFDESMEVWQHYGIPAQPGAVLLDRKGRERERWLGPFDPELAIRAAEQL